MWGSSRRLADYLQDRLTSAQKELNSLNADYLLSENDNVLIAALLEKHMPKPFGVSWAGVTRSPVTEVSTRIQDQFHRDRIHTVPASKITLSFPFTGTADLLNYQASTFNMEDLEGTVSGDSIVLEVVERSLNASVIQTRIERLKNDLEKRANWANVDLQNFLGIAEQSLRNVYSSRKQRILNDRSVEDTLGIPVKVSGAPRQPIPARRKQVSLQERRAQATFAPEPFLDEAIYRDVLEAVQAWARSLERTPGTANKLAEEELRDLLLGTLNGYWNGAAAGELFNGAGKTDILIRENGRNAFIAECKVWHGPKAATEAINQLLGYLVWRDSKAALIMFIKRADPAATIGKLHAAIEAHPRYVLTRGKDTTDPSRQVDYILTADDEGRRISLAVIPVVLNC
ncbi:hypothetical protein ACNJ7E_43515 [Rhodococcus sp. NM-2]|uniref:hypothetical protein n=1 Tax=Rhodococcus sp. NM-2 TaxID=3401174 RepID=UPI003AAE93DE